MIIRAMMKKQFYFCFLFLCASCTQLFPPPLKLNDFGASEEDRKRWKTKGEKAMQSLDLQQPALKKLYSLAKYGNAKERYAAYEILILYWGFQSKISDEDLQQRIHGSWAMLYTDPPWPSRKKTLSIHIAPEDLARAAFIADWANKGEDLGNVIYGCSNFWANKKGDPLIWTNEALRVRLGKIPSTKTSHDK